MKFLKPSNAETWFYCSGSVIAQEEASLTITENSNSSKEALKRGCCLHSLAEICLTNSHMAKDYLGKEHDGYVIDNEIADDVQLYCDYVNAETVSGKLYVEKELGLANVLGMQGEKGKADAIIYNKRRKLLHIFDFKSGRGDEVLADRNLQGIIYALAFIHNNNLSWEDIATVTIHIVQPALGNFSKWDVSFDELMTWHKKIYTASLETLKLNAVKTPGESQCKYCIAKAQCKQLGEHVYDLTNANEELIVKSGTGISDSRKRSLMDNESLISAYIKSIKAETLNIIIEGGEFKGYKVINRNPHRKWIDTALEMLQHEIGDKASVQKIIGFGDAEKLLGKARVKELTTVGNPIKTLVKSSDKRKGVDDIRKILITN